MDKIELLKNTPIFATLTEDIAKLISGKMERLEISEGDIVFAEGAVADSFYIVEEGEIVISKDLKGDKKKVLSVIKSGGVFGEMAFFSDLPRIASARCSSANAILWRIPRDKFFDIVEKHPQAGLKIFSGLLEVAMERLDRTSRELATVYETGRIISRGNSFPEISEAVAEELVVSVPPASHAAVFFYNEFNEDFENPHYDSIPAADPLISVLRAAAEKNTGLIYPSSLWPEKVPPARGDNFLKNSEHFIIVPIIKKGENLLSSRRFPLLGFIALWNECPVSKKGKNQEFQEADTILLFSVAGQLAEAFELLSRREEELNRARLKSNLSTEKPY